MEYRKNTPNQEKDILFTETVKAGKRIYYLDVKKSIRGDLFLSVTESKKVPVKGAEEEQFNFEKHKIFLYQEDFTKFVEALSNAMCYIHDHTETPVAPRQEMEFAPDEQQPADEAEAPAATPEAPAADIAATPAEEDDIPPISLNIDF